MKKTEKKNAHINIHTERKKGKQKRNCWVVFFFVLSSLNYDLMLSDNKRKSIKKNLRLNEFFIAFRSTKLTQREHNKQQRGVHEKMRLNSLFCWFLFFIFKWTMIIKTTRQKVRHRQKNQHKDWKRQKKNNHKNKWNLNSGNFKVKTKANECKSIACKWMINCWELKTVV